MLKNYWYIAAMSKDLGKCPVGITLFNIPIVLFRSGSEVVALEDRCAHRNTPLSAGKVCDGALECSYHGWRYNKEGIAKNPSLPSVDQKNIAIHTYACIEQQGYIWVCPGNVPQTEKPPLIPAIGEKGWTSFRMKTRFSASVEQCLENFLDCPHAAYVHNKWFRSPTEKKVTVLVKTLEDGAEAEYIAEPREKSLVHYTLLASKTPMRHTDRFIAPTTSRVEYFLSEDRRYIITSICSPIKDNETDVYTVITFKYRKIGWLIRLFFEPLCHIIIKQDVRMLQIQQQNIKRFGKQDFTIAKSDILLPHILAWRNALASAVPPPQSGKKKNVEIIL